MMYPMKKINTHQEEIKIPKCMYTLKKILKFDEPEILFSNEEVDIDISAQVIKFLQAPRNEMADLERRQDELLKKIDLLYNRIQKVSSICQSQSIIRVKPKDVSAVIIPPDDIVLSVSPDYLPWFIPVLLKILPEPITINWHIHSSVPTEKVAKIKSFVANLPTSNNGRISIRLIFTSVSANVELKLSSLAVPIVGNVNILRYLSLIYPAAIPYPDEFQVDTLLDICHQLERTNEKNREAAVKNIFANFDGWIYNKNFSIVDIVAYNAIKQWRGCPKYIPKDWFDRMSKF